MPSIVWLFWLRSATSIMKARKNWRFRTKFWTAIPFWKLLGIVKPFEIATLVALANM
jgi:hypothetical protein